MQKLIRRVITAYDKNKQSKVLQDEQIPITIAPEQYPGFTLTELFYTEDSYQNFATEHKNRPYEIELPSGAFRFCVLQIPPLSKLIKHAKEAGMPVASNEKDYLLHRTDSIDYIYILKGEIVLRLDNSEEKSLKSGDFIVQKGSVHAWNNISNEPCDMLAVMIGVKS